MLWLTLWFGVILKIPALYLCYIVWWSVKDPPDASPGGAAGELGGGGGAGRGPGLRPRVSRPTRRLGPHGSPVRRPRPQHAFASVRPRSSR